MRRMRVSPSPLHWANSLKRKDQMVSWMHVDDGIYVDAMVAREIKYIDCTYKLCDDFYFSNIDSRQYLKYSFNWTHCYILKIK